MWWHMLQMLRMHAEVHYISARIDNYIRHHGNTYHLIVHHQIFQNHVIMHNVMLPTYQCIEYSIYACADHNQGYYHASPSLPLRFHSVSYHTDYPPSISLLSTSPLPSLIYPSPLPSPIQLSLPFSFLSPIGEARDI